MRRTVIHLLILILVGAVIFWKEWTHNFTITYPVEDRVSFAPYFSETASTNAVFWLVIVAGGLYVVSELLTKYLKLSSPNSV